MSATDARSSCSPLLRTARLDLWRPQTGDLAGLIELVESEEARRFLGPARADPADQFARLLRNAGCWSLYGYGSFVVRLSGAAAIVGNCGIFQTWRDFGRGMDDVPEAGWTIAREHWGNGLAGEAMRASLDWFDGKHGPVRITCMIESDHTASQRLAARLGFREYDRFVPDGDPAQLVLYERLPG